MNDIGAATPMHVTGIDITGLHFSASKDCHESYVSMEIRPGRTGTPLHVQFLCRARRPEDTPTAIVMQDLIEDALRQANRMPGFRRGERVITVEPLVAPLVDRAIA